MLSNKQKRGSRTKMKLKKAKAWINNSTRNSKSTHSQEEKPLKHNTQDGTNFLTRQYIQCLHRIVLLRTLLLKYIYLQHAQKKNLKKKTQRKITDYVPGVGVTGGSF